MKTRNGSRFQRGSGCYACSCCGKMTRSTGRGDNEHCGLCVDCYDLAGIENGISDNGPECVAEYGQAAKPILERRPELGDKFPSVRDAVATVLS